MVPVLVKFTIEVENCTDDEMSNKYGESLSL